MQNFLALLYSLINCIAAILPALGTEQIRNVGNLAIFVESGAELDSKFLKSPNLGWSIKKNKKLVREFLWLYLNKQNFYSNPKQNRISKTDCEQILERSRIRNWIRNELWVTNFKLSPDLKSTSKALKWNF